MAADEHIAVLFSGQQRTFVDVRASIAEHFVCVLAAQSTVHLFDCSDKGGLSLPAFTFERAPPTANWTWRSSAIESLRQFERASACWEHAKLLEARKRIRLSWIVKTRPDLAVGSPLGMDIAAWGARFARRNEHRALLSRARCWPGRQLPRYSYALERKAWRVG